MKILVVDDEVNVVELVKFNLELNDFEVSFSYDGNEAFDLVKNNKFDLIILDIMLPGKSGLQILKATREQGINQLTPVLMLTAKSEESDIVFGLDLGADDYLAKPFRVHELIARVNSLLRRSNILKQEEVDFFEFKDFTLDDSQKILTVRNKKIDLTKKEFDLLLYLIKHKNTVISREKLLEKIWGYDYYGETRTVDVHIRNLRKKIELDPTSPRYIITVIGSGYKFEYKE